MPGLPQLKVQRRFCFNMDNWKTWNAKELASKIKEKQKLAEQSPEWLIYQQTIQETEDKIKNSKFFSNPQKDGKENPKNILTDRVKTSEMEVNESRDARENGGEGNRESDRDSSKESQEGFKTEKGGEEGNG